MPASLPLNGCLPQAACDEPGYPARHFADTLAEVMLAVFRLHAMINFAPVNIGMAVPGVDEPGVVVIEGQFCSRCLLLWLSAELPGRGLACTAFRLPANGT